MNALHRRLLPQRLRLHGWGDPHSRFADQADGRRSDAASLIALVRADLEASVHPNYRRYSDARFWARALAKVLLQPNLRAVVTFRVAHALATHGQLSLAIVLRARALRRSGAEIHPLATVGPGLHLVHSSGVVIGPNSVIGARARLHQGVTIGEPVHDGAGTWSGARVGDDVVIGAHAVLLGSVTVGDGARVGANSVVTHDVAPGTTVAGAPAAPIASDAGQTSSSAI